MGVAVVALSFVEKVFVYASDSYAGARLYANTVSNHEAGDAHAVDKYDVRWYPGCVVFGSVGKSRCG